MGALAEGVEQRQGDRAAVHHRDHHQAVPGLVGKAGLGQAHIPFRVARQRVGVEEAQRVVRVVEAHGLARRGAQLADHRVLVGGPDQTDQVAGAGYVVFRQPGRLLEAGVPHAQRLGLGVHRPDERAGAARVVVGKAGGGAVFRGHQRQFQHLPAIDLAFQANAGIHALHLGGFGNIDVEQFAHGLLGVQHYHGGHQLGDRGDRRDHVGVAGVNDIVVLQVHHQGATRGQDQRSGGGREFFGGEGIRSADSRGEKKNQTQ
ncbi:hypothetical protein D3C81_1382900 [compost metagenome]